MTRSASFFLAAVSVTLVAHAARADAPDVNGHDRKVTPTVRHAYSLSECLALVDRNHPSLWAARARLAQVHAQLDEARTAPFSQWSTSTIFGALPPIPGTLIYSTAPSTASNPRLTDGTQPRVQFLVNGVEPLFTFGKVTAAAEAAEGLIRVNEWDIEKFRQLARLDARRAYYSLMFAHDSQALVAEVLARLDRIIAAIDQRLEADDKRFSEPDKFRMEMLRVELVARQGEVDRAEVSALAALRFLTGVESGFDIPRDGLHRPDAPLGPVVRYLAAARLFRPEVNMARAGVVARKAQIDFARGYFFPDLGVGLGSAYFHAPSSVPQPIWTPDPYNAFGPGFGLGLRWSLDLLPAAARLAQAEAWLEETRALLRYALGGLAVEVEGAYASVVEANKREAAWAQAQALTVEWLALVERQVKDGKQDERGYGEPLRRYVDMSTAHIASLMDYEVALGQLAQACGVDAAAGQ